jgi:hypothetical protein
MKSPMLWQVHDTTTIEHGAILHSKSDAMENDATIFNSPHQNGSFAALADAGKLDATKDTVSTQSKRANSAMPHASMLSFERKKKHKTTTIHFSTHSFFF